MAKLQNVWTDLIHLRGANMSKQLNISFWKILNSFVFINSDDCAEFVSLKG